jgi:glycosyltransferase involved in cell wall biosynthesis
VTLWMLFRILTYYQNNMKISYAVTVCNELTELQRLLDHLLEYRKPQDEIVVLFDSKNGTKEVENYLRIKSIPTFTGFSWVAAEFDGHFGNWKNKLNSLCTGDFIFQIDADEYLPEEFIDALHQILESNPEVDLYFVPRINTVSGLTMAHVQKWSWNMWNDRVNWPDYQTRVYRNNSEIKWENKVHEKIIGYKQYTTLPAVDELALIHPKTIEKQEKQNSYYETL